MLESLKIMINCRRLICLFFSIPQCTALFSSKEMFFTNNSYEENAQEVNDNVATWLEDDIAGCHMFDSLFHVEAENTFDINIVIAFVKQNATKFNQDGTRLMPFIHFWELLAEHRRLHEGSLWLR